ncbi:MAG: aminoglycoside phosphotransferase family protein [Mesorhizobium sp.]
MTLPDVPQSWNITAWTPLADGIGGRVWTVERAGGERAIVKAPSALALKDGEPPRAVDFLRWRDGQASVRLIDTSGDIQLLEHAGDETLLGHLETHGDDSATEIACDVLLRLHASSPRTVPPSLQPLRDYFQSLFLRADADVAAGLTSQYVEAARVAERLLRAEHAPIPLHGDIHHENIMHGGRGWLTIDPKGLIGDRAFDAANLFYNPIESDLRYSPARIARMSTILSERLNIDRAHLMDWAFAFTALSASWHEEDGNIDEAARSLSVGRAVRDVSI